MGLRADAVILACAPGDDREQLRVLERVQQRARQLGIPQSEVDEWKRRIPEPWLAAAESGRFTAAALARGLFVPDYLVESLDLKGERVERKWAVIESLLTEIILRCRETRIQCGVVYAPVSYQYDPSQWVLPRTIGVTLREEWLTEQSEVERRYQDWASRTKVPFLTLTDEFRRAASLEPGAYNFPLDGHWNARGQELAAHIIGRWLIEQGLAPDVPGPRSIADSSVASSPISRSSKTRQHTPSR